MNIAVAFPISRELLLGHHLSSCVYQMMIATNKIATLIDFYFAYCNAHDKHCGTLRKLYTKIYSGVHIFSHFCDIQKHPQVTSSFYTSANNIRSKGLVSNTCLSPFSSRWGSQTAERSYDSRLAWLRDQCLLINVENRLSIFSRRQVFKWIAFTEKACVISWLLVFSVYGCLNEQYLHYTRKSISKNLLKIKLEIMQFRDIVL